jgi:GNAT superfamily N-acetyltransferase
MHMGPKELVIDGDTVSIQLMDESYIMCDDEKKSGVKVDVDCRHMSPRWPNPLHSLYYRKVLVAYGVGPVLAWQGRSIVGFLPATVPDCGIPEIPLCVHYTGGLAYGAEKHIGLGMVENSSAVPFAQLKKKEIRLGCMSVHRSLRGRSLAAFMIQYMTDWARQNGWDRLKARAMMDGEPMSFYPTHSFWLKLGFKTEGPPRRFGPSDDPIDMARAVDLTLDL